MFREVHQTSNLSGLSSSIVPVKIFFFFTISFVLIFQIMTTPAIEEYELPLFKKYVKVQQKLNTRGGGSGTSNDGNGSQSVPLTNGDTNGDDGINYNVYESRNDYLLRKVSYKRFIPRFINDNNKYFFYVLVLVFCGLLGVFLRKTFDLDFNDVEDNQFNSGGDRFAYGGGHFSNINED